ncbi:unnamed protein product [Soboliphyme baturini]|uniref:UDENN domain-containing protein n=1 Tax=Soboliphyme baturini TaxID=241478 RepID=A0A183IIM2_9BILA|nr:unnamed protein product [Soboliphyme baturini]
MSKGCKYSGCRKLEKYCLYERLKKVISDIYKITQLAYVYTCMHGPYVQVKHNIDVPEGFTCIETTPSGFPADFNYGSIRTPSCFLCFRRGFHKPPIVDIGILYEFKGENPMPDIEVIRKTPYGRIANLNNAKENIFLTYRRARENAASNLFSVIDMCVILPSKGETPPHTYYKLNKNLNKGLVGNDVFLCYKKSLSSVNQIAYRPAILDRFPDDFAGYPLPPSTPLFCLPMGAVIECWPAKCQTPDKQFTTFVLTDQNGHKLYGASVSFYEDYMHPLTKQQMEKLGLNPDAHYRPGSCSDTSSTNDPADEMTFHTNKSICVVSRYPFFSAFRRYLFYLHRMCACGISSLPVEAYITYLMLEVPFPTSKRPRVLVQLGNERICFDNPEDSPLPLTGASYVDFLTLLGTDNCIYMILLALTEQKILIHSLRPWHLTSVAEAICNLIFPFRWQCPYIPQCPLDVAGVLHAPMPFIAGVDSRYFDLYEDPPRDVTCVDLDTNTVSMSDVRQRFKMNLLPRKATKFLRQQLDQLAAETAKELFSVTKMRSNQDFLPVEVDLKFQQRRKNLDLAIQEAFLRFMALLLKGYQMYLRPIKSAPSVGSTDLESLFDVNGFLRSRDKSSQEFYRILVGTQLFIRFIEERSFLTDKDTNTYLAFFDDCMEKIDQFGEVTDHQKLLEMETSVDYDHAVLFAPSESPKAAAPYTYHGIFPKLDFSFVGSGKRVNTFRAQRTPDSGGSLIESTPAARRTKQEAKLAIKTARELALSPLQWAKCLLLYTYKFRVASNVLNRMENAKLPMVDEICYRIMIQMCSLYEDPVLAVKIFVNMRRNGIKPNAVTYAFYNRAVFEAHWPSVKVLTAQKHWTKVRHVVRAIALLRVAVKARYRKRRTASQYSSESGDFISQGSSCSQQVRQGDTISVRVVLIFSNTYCL